ncbi:MAG: hypothetical protein N4A65_00255 [Cohaesibacter sp.]|jgi:hypothetical protein|nr:hypothetical protein [Cohaesibacter sp.]
MREFFGAISSFLTTLPISNGMVVIALFVIIPALLGLIITWGDWRAVLKAFLIWFGGLFALFFVMTIDLKDTLHGALLYGMFFSAITVPIVALIIKITRYFRNRRHSAEFETSSQ